MILVRIVGMLLPMALMGGMTTLGASSEIEEGRRLFRVHCQACHGKSAQGDGAMKERLDTVPADLTTLAERNHGEFPQDEVYAIIDGRREVPTHGNREMPVWGFTFQSSGPDPDQEQVVRGMVEALTRYLESIQVAIAEGSEDSATKR